MRKFDVYPESLKEKAGKELSEEPTIHEGCRMIKSSVGSWTELGKNTTFNEVEFGDYSYTAGNVSIAYATVGKFCSIANSTRINPGNHPQWRVTQNHLTYRRKKFLFDTEDDHEFFQWRRDHHVSIGHDVWIGHGAVVMPGVTVGNGAVIGSGAIVTKDIPPYGVAVGVPAKVIKFRFPQEIIDQLQEIEYWNWDRLTLEDRFDDLLDMEKFLEKYSLNTA